MLQELPELLPRPDLVCEHIMPPGDRHRSVLNKLAGRDAGIGDSATTFRSPQAKGRGGFQDRLVTGLAGSGTIDQANAVLQRFLPSYAGVQVEVLEWPDSQLLVHYRGERFPVNRPRPALEAWPESFNAS